MVADGKIFVEETFDSAKKFLTRILIDGPIGDRPFKGFLYRGVEIGSGEKEHLLIPSALRLDRLPEMARLSQFFLMGPKHEETALKKEMNQIRAELTILASFFRYADTQGLPMPEITSQLRMAMDSEDRNWDLLRDPDILKEGWPPNDLLPLAAQAQHYGLPTRLLDWTRDPWVALYFAARYGQERLKNEAQIENGACVAVWLLSKKVFEILENLEQDKELYEKLPLTVVTAPAAKNPNLRAQQGVFTVWREKIEGDPEQPVDRRPLNELLQESFSDRDTSLPLLYKYMLPLKEVPTLWNILRCSGINRSRMFPDYAGAADAVREENMFL